MFAVTSKADNKTILQIGLMAVLHINHNREIYVCSNCLLHSPTPAFHIYTE